MKTDTLRKCLEIIVAVGVCVEIAHYIDSILLHMGSPWLLLFIWVCSFVPGPIGIVIMRRSNHLKKRFLVGLALVMVFGCLSFIPFRHFANSPPFTKSRLPGFTEFTIWLLGVFGLVIIVVSMILLRKWDGYNDLVEMSDLPGGETPGLKYVTKGDGQSLVDSSKFQNAKTEVETSELRLDKPSNETNAIGSILVAHYDYKGLMEGELSFVEGDQVEILETDARGWWKARSKRTGKEGLVPVNFFLQKSDKS